MHDPKVLMPCAANGHALFGVNAGVVFFGSGGGGHRWDVPHYACPIPRLTSDTLPGYSSAAAPATVEARLKYLLAQAGRSGADVGRFPGLDGTMGHKILRGERKLTVAHGKKLAAAFHLSPSYFIA